MIFYRMEARGKVGILTRFPEDETHKEIHHCFYLFRKYAWERRHPCLHAFIYCGQDGRAPGYIFIIVCESCS